MASLTGPNCKQLKQANKACLTERLRLKETEKSGEEEKSHQQRAYKTLDIVVITFEGVLGSYLPLVPQSSEVKSDTLILRPGVAEAMTELLENFKVVVITGD